MRCKTPLVLAIIAMLFLAAIQPHDACWVPGGNYVGNIRGTLLQALQKGPVRPPGSWCTFTPGRGGPPCINARKFLGGRNINDDHDTVMTVAMANPPPGDGDQGKRREDDAGVVAEQ